MRKTTRYFSVFDGQDRIMLRVNQPLAHMHIHIYLDNQYLTTVVNRQTFILNKRHFPKGSHFLMLSGEVHDYGRSQYVQERYVIRVTSHTRPSELGRQDFRAGDILVASDNASGIPSGYIGHSALVINQERILESVSRTESISIDPVSTFFDGRERYAHFRPVDPEMGEQAVQWGLEYHKAYQENLEKGINKPKFSFTPSKDMTETWDTIYCSKLIWLCYYYGADYEFEVKGLWFSPQNLDDELSRDPNFETIHKHPEHSFYIEL
ncbi:hypothetical protein [Caldalkalibacillus salinus]|uniref:hypothetical protein n=1 Tax=Caldalkalibacillus salinus TaxID=2803787 RepID=UPI001922DC21|nr:hypothetical protein [Caldalkalibacillus salinus]